MGDMGQIPTVSSAVSSSADTMVDAKAISTVVSKFFMAGVGGVTRKIPKVAYAVDDDTVAIPVEGAVGDTGSMPTMMWDDYSTVGDGGNVHDNACSTDSFSDFRIQEGDLQSRTRVFTITISQAPTCYPMDIIATVVLSRSNSMKIYPNLFLCLSVLSFLHGCMYLQSPPSSHRSEHRLQQLHTLRNLYTKKHNIVAIDVIKKNRQAT